MARPAGTTSVGGAVWRHRGLALAAFALVMAGVGWWLRSAPRTYTASATITAAPVTSLLESTGNIENLEATLAQVANSRSVLEDVSTRMNGLRSVATLRNEVRGAHVTGTILIRVTVTDADPHTASDIANTVAAELPQHDPSRGLLQFTQVDPARPPSSYTSPNTRIVALAGIALGLLLATGSALLYDGLAGTVETVDQLGASTGTEVLAAVPRPRRLSAIPAARTGTPSAIAFRSLRAALPFAGTETVGAIVVASASAKRDVSGWVAINLAVAFARMHRRVLLIDGSCADRNEYPALVSDESAGLFGVLRDEAKVEDAFVEGSIEGVTVLPAGHVAPDSVIGLVESRFQKLLSEVDDRFDAVIVVGPPLSESEDAKVMAVGGSFVLSVTARTMRSAPLGVLVRELESAQVRVLGTVLVD